MGVVRRATAGRWGAALGGTVAIALLPSAVAALPADGTDREPRALVRAALASAQVPHEGLAESTGTLGLPDLPRLGTLAALAGGTTRARVWWQSGNRWRVDRVTATGESGTYQVNGVLHTWDFESQEVGSVVAASPVRLPRVDDLLPPQVARRILSGAAAEDRLEPLGARRVAGRDADGVRLVPASPSSTVGRVEVWVDAATSLPLLVQVFPRGGNGAALTSRFLGVRLRRPDPGTLLPKQPPTARTDSTLVQDIAGAIDLYAPFQLPGRLGAVRRSRDVVTLGGAATYGTGLARFVVLPLPPNLGQSSLDAAVGGGGVTLDLVGGEGVLVGTPLLNAVIARAGSGDMDPRARGRRSYLVAGTVDPPTLTAAAEALFARPPPPSR